jgi:hypothetical protein
MFSISEALATNTLVSEVPDITNAFQVRHSLIEEEFLTNNAAASSISYNLLLPTIKINDEAGTFTGKLS